MVSIPARRFVAVATAVILPLVLVLGTVWLFGLGGPFRGLVGRLRRGFVGEGARVRAFRDLGDSIVVLLVFVFVVVVVDDGGGGLVRCFLLGRAFEACVVDSSVFSLLLASSSSEMRNIALGRLVP